MPLRINIEEVWEILQGAVTQEFGTKVGKRDPLPMWFIVHDNTIRELVVGLKEESYSSVEKFTDQIVAEQRRTDKTRQVLIALREAIVLGDVDTTVIPSIDHDNQTRAMSAKLDQILGRALGSTYFDELMNLVSAAKALMQS